MLSTDVVVAGGGVSGLLIASALASECSVILLEQAEVLPRNKYWLTDERALSESPHLETCIDRRYDHLDFVAYDGLKARIKGRYCLWDTDKLVDFLLQRATTGGTEVLTGRRLYSFTHERGGVLVRANSESIKCRLLIDCMGFGSPIVGAKDVATITGYYILHGCEVLTTTGVDPIGLDNVVIGPQPAFFELFPTSRGTAHAAIILPSRQHKPDRSIKAELSFILTKSHYSGQVHWDPSRTHRSYFGIVPVGRLKEPALDRIIFFGEAGQANPATSATGLSRMLRTYQELAHSIKACLKHDRLGRKHLLLAMPRYMTRMNRIFQETLFESLLRFNSDDFRRLVNDLSKYPDDVINDLIFGDFDFGSGRALALALNPLIKPSRVLAPNLVRSVVRFCSWRRSI
jgi:flavin-dependent dehydrogenase